MMSETAVVLQPAPGAPQQPRREIAVQSRGGLLLQSFEDLQRFAKMILESGIVPNTWSIGQVCVAVQMGMEAGLGPLSGLRAVYFVRGLPGWKGEAALGLIRRCPLAEGVDVGVDGQDKERFGWVTSKRRGQSEKKSTFTMSEAIQAGLYKSDSNWSKYTEDMLLWRAVARHARRFWSDVLMNMPIAEEMEGWTEPTYTSSAPARPLPQPSPQLGPDPLLDGLTQNADAAPSDVAAGSGAPDQGETPSAPDVTEVEAQIAKDVDEALGDAPKPKRGRGKKQEASAPEPPAAPTLPDDEITRELLYELALKKGDSYDNAMGLLKKAAGTVVVNALKGKELVAAYRKLEAL